MFKVGEIVYCIDNHDVFNYLGDKITKLEFDTPYIVDDIRFKYNMRLKEVLDFYYFHSLFVSEKNYQISKRKEKLSKIKECLKEVI